MTPLEFTRRVLPVQPVTPLPPKPLLLAPRPRWVSPVKAWIECDRARRDLLEATWTVGELGHLLTPSQLECNDKMEAWARGKKREGRYFVLDSSRRWGKSALLLKRALELAIQNPGWRIVYWAPEYKMVTKIIQPLMALLCTDCPPGLHGKKQGPDWKQGDTTYYFKNGSRIELVGLDKRPDAARGTGIDYGFGDEVAFFEKLEYLVTSIVMPQMLGRPHARLECASTPPVSPSHYWTQEMVPRAVADGAYDTRTIEQADQYDTDEIVEFVKQAGGKDSSTCQREYYCNHITDDSLAIIPEFRRVEHAVVRRIEAPPKFRNCFVAMDPGWKDNTAVLFGYWDFDQKICVVEDEICAPRLTSETVAAQIMLIEKELWNGVPKKTASGALRGRQPYARTTDHDARLQADLANTYGLSFTFTAKDNLQQQVDAVRVAFSRGQIVIHPRCQKLIAQLRNGVWKNSRSRLQFEWTGGDFGHYDAIHALIYLWRIMQEKARLNPYPIEVYRVNSQDHNPNLGQRPEGSKWGLHNRQLRYR